MGSAYHPSFGVDPSGPLTGSHRVLRGGSWISNAEELRSGDSFSGFRLVRTRIRSKREDSALRENFAREGIES
jgi:hypothetical protein